MPQSWDMGDSFTSPPEEGMLRIFTAGKKNPTTSAGFELANLDARGLHGNHQTTEAVCLCT